MNKMEVGLVILHKLNFKDILITIMFTLKGIFIQDICSGGNMPFRSKHGGGGGGGD